MENLEYGGGGLSINTATVTELDRAGLSRSVAAKVVAFRDEHGAFESLAELRDVKGIGPKTLERLSEVMTDNGIVGAYSARVPGAAAATTAASWREAASRKTAPLSRRWAATSRRRSSTCCGARSRATPFASRCTASRRRHRS